MAVFGEIPVAPTPGWKEMTVGRATAGCGAVVKVAEYCAAG